MSVENLQGEIWKVIDHPSIGCYDNYAISNYGRVKSVNYRNTGKERLFKGSKDKDGYLRVLLRYKGEKKQFFVHRLLAIVYLENPLNLPCVNHKIEGKEGRSMNFIFFKADGEVDLERTTIEWVTHKENSNYGDCVERMLETRKNSKAWVESRLKIAVKRSKQVYQYTIDGIVDIYPSTMEAAQKTGCSQSAIGACCRGELTNHKGFIWSYTQLTDNQISVLIASMKQNKPVYQYDQNFKLIGTYKNLKEAAQLTGLKKGSICACCSGQLKTHKNFIWSYEPIETSSNQLTLFPLTEKKIS